jgi:uncharacterized membrane protein
LISKIEKERKAKRQKDKQTVKLTSIRSCSPLPRLWNGMTLWTYTLWNGTTTLAFNIGIRSFFGKCITMFSLISKIEKERKAKRQKDKQTVKLTSIRSCSPFLRLWNGMTQRTNMFMERNNHISLQQWN